MHCLFRLPAYRFRQGPELIDNKTNVTNLDLQTFSVDEAHTGTLLSALRQWLPGESWSALRKLVQARRVAVNGVLCLDEARRLTAGETVTVSSRSLPPPPSESDVRIRFVDRTMVVVEKPSGMVTLRPKSELHWPARRRQLQPTLDESVALLIARHAASRAKGRGKPKLPSLFAVHRLDRDTSGLLVLARSQEAQQRLISQFAQRTARRAYLALIPGHPRDQTIRSQLVRDRGDGLRGSQPDANAGQTAITHVRVLRRIAEYSELCCQLETGRTNQIRIHLAELGHPICGDIKYRGPLGSAAIRDTSGVPRLALHATQLQLEHPETNEPLDYESPWPMDIQMFLNQLQGAARRT